ncbi:MAG: class I SAM-dependent methyltransferase [Candidatus Delongbacteria bacterium]|nr:class I SAM-dependent methyltransferase [Candidatus Delongbacteria bacterium]MBN2833837.1 class I SAM-dependent methyltransferase [Candidatus Delongbacteria bacterium]
MFKYDLKKIKEFTAKNRIAWNDVMPLHQKANGTRWDERFADPQFSAQDENEKAEFNRVGFIGKNIAQFCCNNGVELLSLKRAGAGRCVGFDISDSAIEEANERAKRFNITVEYVQSDIYEIGSEYDNQFDIVYFTVGAIGWLPDLDKLWSICTRLLRENGQILIYEQHPFSLVFSGDGAENPLNPS